MNNNIMFLKIVFCIQPDSLSYSLFKEEKKVISFYETIDDGYNYHYYYYVVIVYILYLKYMNDKIQFLNKIFYACPEKVKYIFFNSKDKMVYTFYYKKNENYFFYNTLTLSS